MHFFLPGLPRTTALRWVLEPGRAVCWWLQGWAARKLRLLLAEAFAALMLGVPVACCPTLRCYPLPTRTSSALPCTRPWHLQTGARAFPLRHDWPLSPKCR
jgi:hypothetical protein